MIIMMLTYMAKQSFRRGQEMKTLMELGKLPCIHSK